MAIFYSLLRIHFDDDDDDDDDDDVDDGNGDGDGDGDDDGDNDVDVDAQYHVLYDRIMVMKIYNIWPKYNMGNIEIALKQ